MNKKTILLLVSIIMFVVSDAQVDNYLKEARQLRDAYKDREALGKFKQVLVFDANNLEALCNVSILSSKLGKREADKVKQKKLYNNAKSYAQKALKVNSNDVESNFSMALAMGRMAQISPTNEKVAAVRDIKKYAETALKINSKHAASWHLLAIWNLDVSNLNYAEKKAADWFFGGIPDASKTKAIECCQNAIKNNPTYLLYQYDMARIYSEAGDKTKAKEVLNKLVKQKPITPDDPGMLENARKMLSELK